MLLILLHCDEIALLLSETSNEYRFSSLYPVSSVSSDDH